MIEQAPQALRNLLPSNVSVRGDLLGLAFEHIPFGVCMFDAEDRLILANSRFREIYDHPLELVCPGTPFRSIIAATKGTEVVSRGTLETGAERPLHNQPDDKIIVREWQLEDGRQIEITVARIADGSCVALHEDVTEQRRALSRIVYLSRHDPLTGLLNRDRFFAALERELDNSEKGAVTVFAIDLDGFKAINDSMGHAAGDELIIQVARRLSEAFEARGQIGRLGGDEFALLISGLRQFDTASALGDLIIELLRAPYILSGTLRCISASVGFATVSRRGETADQLLKYADIAMYRAKHNGRNRAEQFESGTLVSVTDTVATGGQALG